MDKIDQFDLEKEFYKRITTVWYEHISRIAIYFIIFMLGAYAAFYWTKKHGYEDAHEEEDDNG